MKEKLTQKHLDAIKDYYHHSAFSRKEDFNDTDKYYMQSYVGRFGIGIKVFLPKSYEIQYYIFKTKDHENK